MLDSAHVRDHLDDVRAGLRNRGLQPDAELEQIVTLETRRRRLIPEMEGLKREQNAAGDEVARAKRQGKDASEILAANKALACRSGSSKFGRSFCIRRLALMTIRTCRTRACLSGRAPQQPEVAPPRRARGPFDFEPRPHWIWTRALDHRLRARTKISGSRFSVLCGRRSGARASSLHARCAHPRSMRIRVRASVSVTLCPGGTETCRSSNNCSQSRRGDLYLIPMRKSR